MSFSRRAKVGALGLTLALTTAACGGGGGDDPADTNASGDGELKKGGTLQVLALGDFEHLDPQRSYVTTSSTFNRLISRQLTTFRGEGGKAGSEVVPDLATDLGESSDDAKTWTFTLKDNVKYEDGTPITAADVKYGVERSFADILPEGAPYARQYLDCEGYKGPYKDPGGCDAITVEGNKITFKLNQPVGDFAYTVSGSTFTPVPKSKDKGVQYDARPFSSGPYKIESYQRGKQITLVRNDNWDRETDEVRTAMPDRVVATFTVDAPVIDQRLIASQGNDAYAVPLGTDIQPESIAQVVGDQNMKGRTLSGTTGCNRYLALNTKKGITQKLEVRQAINYAVNKESYRTARGGENFGNINSQILVPSIQGHEEFNLYEAPPEGDVEKAKELLAKAGVSNATVTLATTNIGKGPTQAAAVQEALARVGIKANIQSSDPSVYYTEIGDAAKSPEMMFYGWCPDWPSASTVLPVLFHGKSIQPQGNQNVSQLNDPEVNALLDRAAAEADLDEQAEMYAKADRLIMEQAPIVPLIVDKSTQVVGSKVRNAHYATGIGGVIDFATIALDTRR